MTDCEKTLAQSGIDNADAIYDQVGGPSAWYGVQFLIAQLYDRTLEEIGPDLAHQAFDLLYNSIDQIHNVALENADNNTNNSVIAKFA